MNLFLAYQKLKTLAPVFLTKQAAVVLKVSSKHASVILSRLAKEKTVVRLAQGRWVYSSEVDPLLFPQILTNPMISYISLYSALYYHGMIDQIPEKVFAVTMAKTRVFVTPLATISTHHINSKLFTGYQAYGKSNLLMATPEKALFDSLYFMPARSNLFKKLTELHLPDNFDITLFEKWSSAINNAGRFKIVETHKHRIFTENQFK